MIDDGITKRFWAKVNKTPTCWLWTGAKQHNGYGFLHSGTNSNRKPVRAHRFSWALHNGEITDGLWVLHKCDTPSCVNPDHLFLGDRVDNMNDAAAKGRITTIGKSKLAQCKRGHEFTEDNITRRPNGHRRCRACLKLEYARAAENRAAIRARSASPKPGSGV